MIRNVLIFALTFMAVFSFGTIIAEKRHGERYEIAAQIRRIDMKLDYLRDQAHARQNENIRIMKRINDVERR